MRRVLCGILAMCIAIGMVGCSGEHQQNADNSISPVSRDFFAMNTYIRLEAYGDKAADALSQAQERIEELESRWSTTDENSEIYAVNHSDGHSITVSEDTAAVVSFALEMAEKTRGALEPTIYPVLTAWGFTTENHRVPEQEEINRLLTTVDYQNVSIDGNAIQLETGMMLDLGAVGKGYASDEIATLLREEGVTSALLNLGGNIMMIGSRFDGSDWHLGLQSPFENNTLGILTVSDSAVVTSGNYENFFTAEDGTTYGHIIDPATGYPVNNGLASVTIVAQDGKTCDALSTALFVMGTDGAIEYWREYPGFEMILITQERQVLVTDGLEGHFILDKNYSDMEVDVVKR